ncbi:MAG: hypothetical protein ACJ0QL_01640 [Parvicellaceae bacterium]
MSSHALFDLISSLTMSEKRYFKLFSSRHVIGESNDYIHLFNAIEKQKVYSEDVLKKASYVKNLSQEKKLSVSTSFKKFECLPFKFK